MLFIFLTDIFLTKFESDQQRCQKDEGQKYGEERLYVMRFIFLTGSQLEEGIVKKMGRRGCM